MTTNFGRDFAPTVWTTSVVLPRSDWKSPSNVDLRQGTLVTLDTTKPKMLKKAAGTEKFVGLLVQKDVLEARDLAAPGFVDSLAREVCRRNHVSLFFPLSKGFAVTYTNIVAHTKRGRDFAAVTRWSGSLNVGDQVGWDGDKWVAASETVPALGTVTGTAAEFGPNTIEITF